MRQVIGGARSADALRLETECRTAAGFRSAVVFGTGVGIWQRERQFRLAPADLQRLLGGLDRFFLLREVYGVGEQAERPMTITCSVTLSIDDERRRVAQIDRGEKSKELEELALRILDVCRSPGEAGVSVSSLEDGLRKVARGVLPGEVLTVAVNHQPRSGDEGWLLQLSGRRLTSQVLRPEGGYGDVVGLILAEGDTAALAALLSEAAVWELPGNLSLPGYTDLRVAVLGKSKEIQARTFAGRSAPPEEAARFDRIESSLEVLHRRAQRQGPP